MSKVNQSVTGMLGNLVSKTTKNVSLCFMILFAGLIFFSSCEETEEITPTMDPPLEIQSIDPPNEEDDGDDGPVEGESDPD